MLELDGRTLTYEVFRDVCLRPNRPAVVRNACRDACGATFFDLAELRRRLHPAELQRRLGPQAPVPVYTVSSTARSAQCDDGVPCSGADAVHDHGDEGECREVPLEVVLRSWTGPAAPHVHYLKDWHLQAALESLATTACEVHDVHGDGLYRVPPFLGADWMDVFCRRARPAAAPPSSEEVTTPAGFGNGESDYRFCYMGPVGTWTPLHHDVFGTYSWSFNVCGDKLWYFPTPAGNAYLRRHLLPLFPTPPDLRVLAGVELEAVVQRPGDLVFVPALFYHQVHNISGDVFVVADGAAAALTVALNHNWCNAFSVEGMAAGLVADAHHLTSRLSTDDVAAICDTSDPAVWRRFADRLLHSGANWSFASMTHFLDFCLARLVSGAPTAVGAEDERATAVTLVSRLRRRLDEEYADLFS
ncbi:JmjC domain, hydroxylase [Novymonas esmeraldas]|uniref:JmjC domain, hydroxylase n=1 Tax=Novymonas esmeraldas TaxID=1808958 RepID=A0AAW0EY97_9TRYP